MKNFTHFYTQKFITTLTIFAVFVGVIASIVGGVILTKNVTHAETGGSESAKFELPEVYVRAVSNAEQLVILGVRDAAPGNLISLASYDFIYTNSSGGTSSFIEWPEHLMVTSEKITLRKASTVTDTALANLAYANTVAKSGGAGLSIMRGGEVVDSVCWGKKVPCGSTQAFDDAEHKYLVRNLEDGTWSFAAELPEDIVYNADAVKWEEGFEPGMGGGSSGADEEAVSSDPKESQCYGLKFSEILSYYAETQSEQFIELYNSGAEQILLDGCLIKYKNKTYPLSGIVRAESYYVRQVSDFSLTKNPTNSNVLEIVDIAGRVVDRLEYPNGQRKGLSYAWIGYNEDGTELWKVTYAVTPGEANVYQEFRTCEDGKVLNEATGNCVKVMSISEKVCGEGQYLNPLTGRCKKIETTTTTECKEGYYLYEPTGRCRKLTTNDGADYALVPETYAESTSFTALYIILGVVGVGIIYVIYEFRHDLVRLGRKVSRRFRR